jgi:hypothetical protein
MNPGEGARGGLRRRPQAAGAGPRRRRHGRRLANGCSTSGSCVARGGV